MLLLLFVIICSYERKDFIHSFNNNNNNKSKVV